MIFWIVRSGETGRSEGVSAFVGVGRDIESDVALIRVQ